MSDTEVLLSAYDAQLRTAAEVGGADGVERLGPLWLATYGGSRGFVTYASLADDGAAAVDAGVVRGLVSAALEHFAADPGIASVEWKTRGHDHAPGLHGALTDAGFVAGEPEAIMLGDAETVVHSLDAAARGAGAPAVPQGVTLATVTDLDGLERVQRCCDEVFGPSPWSTPESVLERIKGLPGYQVWVAQLDDGTVVGTGRLAPVETTPFAGLWGGCVLPQWRGRGLYRALLAARARGALDVGSRYLHSDSTPASRPILERLGLHACSTTTPYTWTRPT